MERDKKARGLVQKNIKRQTNERKVPILKIDVYFSFRKLLYLVADVARNIGQMCKKAKLKILAMKHFCTYHEVD